MAKLTSTQIFGNLDVTGVITSSGGIMGSGGASDDLIEKVDVLQQSTVTTAANLVQVQKNVANLETQLDGYQGPVEMQTANGYIQWRKAGTTAWNNLVATSGLMPSLKPLEDQLDTLKSQLVKTITDLEAKVSNTLNVSISNAEIDTIIANALK